jgi:hypothetical protein
MLELLFPPAIGLHWREQQYPLIRGTPPSSRMHFGACCVGQYLVVAGGTVPSCLRHIPVDSPQVGKLRQYFWCFLTQMIELEAF